MPLPNIEGSGPPAPACRCGHTHIHSHSLAYIHTYTRIHFFKSSNFLGIIFRFPSLHRHLLPNRLLYVCELPFLFPFSLSIQIWALISSLSGTTEVISLFQKFIGKGERFEMPTVAKLRARNLIQVSHMGGRALTV